MLGDAYQLGTAVTITTYQAAQAVGFAAAAGAMALIRLARPVAAGAAAQHAGACPVIALIGAAGALAAAPIPVS